MRDVLLIIALGVGGWIIGCFINYLSDVLPRTRSFSPPVCHECGANNSFLSIFTLKRCRACGSLRKNRTWIVQGVCVILFPVLGYYPPDRLGFWISSVYFIYFAIVFIVDVEHRVILNEMSIAGVVLAIPLGLWMNGWQKTFIGGIAGYAIMFGLYYFGVLFNRLMAKMRGQTVEEVALGFGDVNLSGVLGLMLGWPKIGISLFASVMLAGLLSGFYILWMLIRKRYQAFSAIPYAPFLIIAAVILFYLA